MANYAIIEIEDGFEVVEVLLGQSPQEAAIEACGKLIDPGPYATFEEATDALAQLEIIDERE